MQMRRRCSCMGPTGPQYDEHPANHTARNKLMSDKALPRAQLCRLPHISLEYYQAGHGPRRILLIHGLEASARIWAGVQMALPPERYTTVAINNRGAGNSDTPPDDAAFSVEAFASDAYAVALALGWSTFSLVGHSMGGATAAQMALDHPDCLEALILLNPANPGGRPGSRDELERRIALFLQMRRERLLQSHAAPGSLHDRAVASDWRSLLELDMANTAERRLRGSLRSLHALHIGDRLHTVTAPTLLACGDQDEVIALEDMLRTWSVLPAGSGLQVWHGVGHSPNLDYPEHTASLLDQFLSGSHGSTN